VSLFKQVLLVIMVIFTLLFLVISSVTFSILQKSAKESLLDNVQNSATNISLSITNAGVDESSIKTVIGASFDNGNYEKIVFRDVHGVVVYEVEKDTFDGKDIPPKFIKFMKLYDLGELSASANVSSGWSNLGVLKVYANRATYYEQMYAVFSKFILYASGGFAALLVTLFILFRFMLEPLKRVSAQAKAVLNSEFIVVDKLPFTKEFRSVTLSINGMVKKSEEIFNQANELLKANRELMYIDGTTKLTNRTFFILKMKEYMSGDSLKNSGYFMIFTIKIDIVNKTYGYAKTNQILLDFATKLQELFDSNDSVISRLNGSEILALCPNEEIEDIRAKINLLSKFVEKTELAEHILLGVGRYEDEKDLKEFFIKVDFISGQSKPLSDEKCYFVQDYKTHRTKDEWIAIINKSLSEDGFKLKLNEVLDIQTSKILHSQIFIDLETIEYSFAEFMASIRRLGRLDEVYFHIIQKALNLKPNSLLSLKLPYEFIQNLNNYTLLKDMLAKHKNTKMIFEIEESLLSTHKDNVAMFVELFKECGFSYAIYNFIANEQEYGYLKQSKPRYIKANIEFLNSSTQSLNIVKMLSTSLGIKLIAVIEDELDEDGLKDLGIEAFVKVG